LELKLSKFDIESVNETIQAFDEEWTEVKKTLSDLALGINTSVFTEEIDRKRVDDVQRMVKSLISDDTFDVEKFLDNWEFSGFAFEHFLCERFSKSVDRESRAAKALDDVTKVQATMTTNCELLAVLCHLILSHNDFYTTVMSRSARRTATTRASASDGDKSAKTRKEFVGKMVNFLLKIQDAYNEVPYHCAAHATEVVHAINWIMRNVAVLRDAGEVTHFAMIITAAAHDVSHTGHGNAFHQSAKSSIAFSKGSLAEVVAADFLADADDVTDDSSAVVAVESPLEEMHAEFALSLMREGSARESHWISFMSSADAIWLRTVLRECILATDMKQHMSLTAQINAHVGKPVETAEDVLFLLKIALKTADLSNAFKASESSRIWGTLIADESMRQVAHEKVLFGEAISSGPLFDGVSSKAKIQCGFMGWISAFASGGARLFPECDVLHDKFKSNFAYWRAKKERDDALGETVPKKGLVTRDDVAEIDEMRSRASIEKSDGDDHKSESISSTSKSTETSVEVQSIDSEMARFEMNDDALLFDEMMDGSGDEDEDEARSYGHGSTDTTLIAADEIDLVD
jgi:hypothetical protein